MKKNVISVIDGAAGSCGKAKVIGEIATDKSINLGAAVTNCMPNAGHSFVDENGKKTIFRNIPVSIVNSNTELFIGPGSAIDMETFMEEYENVKHYLGDRRIYVHEMVPLIEQRHKNYEKENIKSGSTFKGCGSVVQDKVIRDERLKFFKTFKNAIVCSNSEWLDRLYEHLDSPNELTMLEGAQGCDLSLNHSGNYPYVTSRNVSTAQSLADSGISANRLLQTIMVIRPFPIRISSITKNGNIIYSGAYGDGKELSWSQINISSQEHSYPFDGDIESGWYDYSFTVDLDNSKSAIINMYSFLPEPFKKQLFQQNWIHPNFENINVIKTLEIERLYNKSIGNNYYESLVLRQGQKGYIISDLSEETTVTKMERRIFNIDINKLKNNIKINDPYGLYLNFFQHLDQDYFCKQGRMKDFKFNRNTIEKYIEWLESETGKNILAFGTGPKNNERILLKKLIKKQ